ncbi:MAG: hypothetical protein WCX28_14775, partial [Bacteriovoracaceae bacterium]
MRSILFFSFFYLSLASAQFEPRSTELPKDTLASIGSRIITAKDFLERFELMPWPNKDKVNRIEYTKLEFLHSIVAEKLLAQEAAAQNIGTDSSSLKLQNNYERLFVRDEYYKTEVQSRIVITPSEALAGMSRFPYEFEVAVLGILSKEEGELLYKKVAKSKNKNATVKFFNDSLYVVIDTVHVTYGFPEEVVEDAVFAIGKDSLSRPVETQAYGWVMFALLKKYTNVQNVKYSHPDRLHKVNNVIRERKEDSIAVRTFAAVTSPQRAEADPAVFFPIADSVYAILRADSTAYLSKGVYQFNAGAIALLEQKLSSRLRDRFITIESGNMTVEDVLQGLFNNVVVFPSPLHLDHIRIVLNNNIKTVIQNEMLAREGLKKNLHQTESVRHDVGVWMDSHKSRMLLRNIIDTLRRTTDTLQQKRLERYIQESIDRYIGTLAKRYNVTINEEALRRVSTTTSSMV